VLVGVAEGRRDGAGGGVVVNNFVGFAVLGEEAVVEVDGGGAELSDGGHVVGDEQNSAAFVGDFLEFTETFFLELDVADGEDFVDDQDFRVEMCGDGEGEADVHAGGVTLDRRVEEFVDGGELDDVIELLEDFASAHAEDGAVEEDVFAAGEFGVEACADFEERADGSEELDGAGGGVGDAGEDFEECGFSCAVAADDAEDFAAVYVEVEVFEGPEGFGVGTAEGVAGSVKDVFGESGVAGALVGQHVTLGEVAYGDSEIAG